MRRDKLADNDVEDKVDDGVGQDGDDETDKSVKDSVLGVGDFFGVASGDGIF